MQQVCYVKLDLAEILDHPYQKHAASKMNKCTRFTILMSITDPTVLLIYHSAS